MYVIILVEKHSVRDSFASRAFVHWCQPMELPENVVTGHDLYCSYGGASAVCKEWLMWICSMLSPGCVTEGNRAELSFCPVEDLLAVTIDLLEAQVSAKYIINPTMNARMTMGEAV